MEIITAMSEKGLKEKLFALVKLMLAVSKIDTNVNIFYIFYIEFVLLFLVKPLSTQDFNCIYYYREKMECTWSIPNNPIHTNYTLFEYTHGMKE